MAVIIAAMEIGAPGTPTLAAAATVGNGLAPWQIGSLGPNGTVTAYSTRDTDLNGQVKYTGSGNDRDPILVNTGSTTPNATRVAQLP